MKGAPDRLIGHRPGDGSGSTLTFVAALHGNVGALERGVRFHFPIPMVLGLEAMAWIALAAAGAVRHADIPGPDPVGRLRDAAAGTPPWRRSAAGTSFHGDGRSSWSPDTGDSNP